MIIDNLRGHSIAKRGLEVAIAGKHSVVLVGPVGVGKSTIASCFNTYEQWMKQAISKTPYCKTFSNYVNVLEIQSCPCGHYGSVLRDCLCELEKVRRYYNRVMRRVSQIEIYLEVSPLSVKEMQSKPQPGAKEAMLARIAEMPHYTDMHMDDNVSRIIEMAARKLGFSTGQYDAAMRVARTIANLDHSTFIKAMHIAESVQYSPALLYRHSQQP